MIPEVLVITERGREALAPAIDRLVAQLEVDEVLGPKMASAEWTPRMVALGILLERYAHGIDE